MKTKELDRVLKEFQAKYLKIVQTYKKIVSENPLTKYEYEAAYRQLKELELEVIDLKNQADLIASDLSSEYNVSLAKLFEYGRDWKSYKELELLAESTNPGTEMLRQYLSKMETYSRTCDKLLQSIGTTSHHLISLCPKE